MRYTQSEKMEIIRMVENSDLPVKTTLEELDVKGEQLLQVVPEIHRGRIRRACSTKALGEEVLEPYTGP